MTTQDDGHKAIDGQQPIGMTVTYREEETLCPRCESTREVRIVKGFPPAYCTNCGWNRA